MGYVDYFWHLNKLPVFGVFDVDEAKAIIIIVSKGHDKWFISEAILNFSNDANIIMKINSTDEQKHLKNLSEVEFVDTSHEISMLLVDRAMKSKA